jgi:hypothetical protein
MSPGCLQQGKLMLKLGSSKYSIRNLGHIFSSVSYFKDMSYVYLLRVSEIFIVIDKNIA